MNRIEYKPFGKIKERDGLLMRQLYDLMPEDKRPSYSHFRRIIQKERSKHDILCFNATERSNSLFLTTNRDIQRRRIDLMILVAEWEIYHQEHAFWYKPTNELWKVYQVFFEQIPSPETIKDTYERDLLISYKYDIAYNRDYIKLVMNEKINRFETLRRKRLAEKGFSNLDDINSNEINPDIRFYKDEMVPVVIRKASDNKPDVIKMVMKKVFRKTYMVMGKPIIKDKPFDISIYGLFSRGIMLRFKSFNKKNIDSIEWYWFDSEKRITKERFEEGVRAIFDFMIFNDYNRNSFSITIYTWNQRKVDSYKNSLKITEKMLSLNEPGLRKGLRNKIFKSKERFMGVEIINLNTDRYLNKVRTPGKKAPISVQEAYGFIDD